MWQILSLIIYAELILPSPKNVFITVLKIIQNQSFWIHFLHTFQRIIISFIISIFFGTILGICCGLNPYVNQFFKLPISILRATPIVAFILIALFWFNSSTIPIFVSVVMTLPLISTSVVSGFENTEEKILSAIETDKCEKVVSQSYVEKETIKILENKVKIIDFRFASMNSPFFDIAYFSNSFNLNEKQDKFLLTKYFGYKLRTKYFKLIEHYKKYINLLRYYRNCYYYTISGEVVYLDIKNELKNKISNI
jgi:hypothetical protein